MKTLLIPSLGRLLPFKSAARAVPAADRRATELRHLNMVCAFQAPRTKEEWVGRAAELRRQILVSAGLWPPPPRTPLNASVFGKVDCGDHTIEKVYFESYPGFYVTGNLYRPKEVGGKIPAVLCTHGHWLYGRVENQQLSSGPLRAASFARLGFVAFAYDMVGYGDSAAVSHKFADHRQALAPESLWGVNLLGLQLWNSVRAVDFLESLPEVDAGRIGCTGESGGASQTFLLTAVDDRIKVSAPVNMISAKMQGGSLCENAPNLRVDTNNMEIGAMMAPRPMLMISSSRDWTRNTLKFEYPAVRGVYRLFGAEDRLQLFHQDAPHNYNKASREAVYGWFSHWLQGRAERTPIQEQIDAVPAIADQLVFYARPRPANELNEQQLSAALVESARRRLGESVPGDAAGLARFREQYGVAFKHALMAEAPRPEDVVAGPIEAGTAGNAGESFTISRRGKGDAVRLTVCRPARNSRPAYTLVVAPHAAELSRRLIEGLLEEGHTVAVMKCFAGRANPADVAKVGFYTTYNRTDESNRVQDILTAIVYLKRLAGAARLNVLGQGEAGLWTLLARGLAPQVDQMTVDVGRFDNAGDEAFLRRLPIPCVRAAGDFTTAALLAPLTPLVIHNAGDIFRAAEIDDAYRRLGAAEDLQVHQEKLNEDDLLALHKEPASQALKGQWR
jgi:dienelactone hydrolase